MSAAAGLAAAAVFTWLGMTAAISFLEAPLKFRAPGVTVPIGLGIGRLVFRALNIAESVLAVVVAASVAAGAIAGSLSVAAVVSAGVPVLVLAVQLAAIRPRLNRRSDRVLAGEDVPRSRAHHAYVLTETVKLLALLAAGVLLLSS